ncbi:hypothetical protein ACFWQC_00455 [Nocardioides sp. NPDC058538]|uniref:hypothetical protein n=1 Tax=Nocardioides sp. NPDC058538 TaxID=3346542 RepID=UPI00365806E3
MSNTPPSSDTRESKPARIDWLATTAGALAAVTSAVLLSTLGAVGTLVGAALGSVAATVGTNLYSQWLAKSHEKVTSVQALGRWRSAGLAGVRASSETATERTSGSVAEAAEAAEVGDAAEGGDTEPTPSWQERLKTLPWKRIALLSLAMFVVVVVAITIFELAAGRSVSSIVGDGDSSTTISRVTGGGSEKRDEKRDEDPSPGATATPEESAGASTEPSEPTEPSESAATETPSAEPSSSTGSSASPSAQPNEGGGVSAEPSPTVGASPGAGDQATP